MVRPSVPRGLSAAAAHRAAGRPTGVGLVRPRYQRTRTPSEAFMPDLTRAAPPAAQNSQQSSAAPLAPATCTKQCMSCTNRAPPNGNTSPPRLSRQEMQVSSSFLIRWRNSAVRRYPFSKQSMTSCANDRSIYDFYLKIPRSRCHHPTTL